MISQPRDLVIPAKTAGMKVPPYPAYSDQTLYSADDYPHWFLFVNMQLDRPMPNKHTHWSNAEVVAKLTDEEANSITEQQLFDKGFVVGFANVLNNKD